MNATGGEGWWCLSRLNFNDGSPTLQRQEASGASCESQLPMHAPYDRAGVSVRSVGNKCGECFAAVQLHVTYFRRVECHPSRAASALIENVSALLQNGRNKEPDHRARLQGVSGTMSAAEKWEKNDPRQFRLSQLHPPKPRTHPSLAALSVLLHYHYSSSVSISGARQFARARTYSRDLSGRCVPARSVLWRSSTGSDVRRASWHLTSFRLEGIYHQKIVAPSLREGLNDERFRNTS